MPAPVLSHAFRVFFLAAALWAALAVPLWLLAYAGHIGISDRYGNLGWHAHELIFGYGGAVVCGFLFTAIPNWTGRLPLSGKPLLILALLWIAGRIAMAGADAIGGLAAALIDCLFLSAVIAAAARELVAGGNRHNLVVVALVSLLLAGNVWFHVAGLTGGQTDTPLRAAIGVLIALIVLIGGRIVPSFTRNWLARRNVRRLPAPASRFDIAAMLAGLAGMLAWVIAPWSAVTGWLALIAGIALAARLARWRGWAAWREPLVLILHLGYGFVPVGFLLLAGGLLLPGVFPVNAATHAWTAGAIGTMTLAVMTRASLGHTGRGLTAPPSTSAIYACVLAAAVLRMTAPFVPDHYLTLLVCAGVAWTAAFTGFIAVYGPILIAPRFDGYPVKT